jgi:hypothetical protein
VQLDPVVIRDTVLAALTHAAFPWQRCGSRLPRRGRQEGRSADGDLGVRAGHRATGDASPMSRRASWAAAGSDVCLRAEPARRDHSPAPPPAAPDRRLPVGARTPNRIAIRADNNIVVSMIEKEPAARRPEHASSPAAGQFPGSTIRWVLMAKHRSGIARGRGRRRAGGAICGSARAS